MSVVRACMFVCMYTCMDVLAGAILRPHTRVCCTHSSWPRRTMRFPTLRKAMMRCSANRRGPWCGVCVLGGGGGNEKAGLSGRFRRGAQYCYDDQPVPIRTTKPSMFAWACTMLSPVALMTAGMMANAPPPPPPPPAAGVMPPGPPPPDAAAAAAATATTGVRTSEHVRFRRRHRPQVGRTRSHRTCGEVGCDGVGWVSGKMRRPATAATFSPFNTHNHHHGPSRSCRAHRPSPGAASARRRQAPLPFCACARCSHRRRRRHPRPGQAASQITSGPPLLPPSTPSPVPAATPPPAAWNTEDRCRMVPSRDGVRGFIKRK